MCDDKKNFTESQKHAYDTIMSGHNVCILGSGGVGKTYLLNEAIISLEQNKKSVLCCAPTGIAALGLHGCTIHRMLKCGIYKPLDIEQDVSIIKPDHPLVLTDVLIIDEIAMCRMDLFDYLCACIEKANKFRSHKRRKPIQVIVSGDFFQIPPVVSSKDRKILEYRFPERPITSAFPFCGHAWKGMNFKYCVLDEIVRQQDEQFAQALEKVRSGYFDGVEWIMQHCSDDRIKNAIILCGTNAAADKCNQVELDKLPGDELISRARTIGKVADNEKSAPEFLILKKGARVMAVSNDMGGAYSNGSLGCVEAIEGRSVYVRWDSGNSSKVERAVWEVTEPRVISDGLGGGYVDQQVIGSYEQLPLKLGYAVTIHKSQGQTFDAVHIFPSCFVSGQLYTALSRATTVEGISFEYPPKEKDLICTDDAVGFYAALMRALSRSCTDEQKYA